MNKNMDLARQPVKEGHGHSLRIYHTDPVLEGEILVKTQVV